MSLLPLLRVCALFSYNNTTCTTVSDGRDVCGASLSHRWCDRSTPTATTMKLTATTVSPTATTSILTPTTATPTTTTVAGRGLEGQVARCSSRGRAKVFCIGAPSSNILLGVWPCRRSTGLAEDCVCHRAGVRGDCQSAWSHCSRPCNTGGPNKV
jgi:hypothetical protein